MESLADPHFWLGAGKITLINIVLSIDNAIVIALVARALPAHQQTQAVVCGTVAITALRTSVTLLVTALLTLPYLKLAGGVLLLWIAVKLLLPQQEVSRPAMRADVVTAGLPKAIGTIVIADLVMSVDNVMGVAAAAAGNAALLIAGLMLSIPLVIFCASILMRLMQRWPVIIVIGAALLGWVAGDLLVSDVLWRDSLIRQLPWLHVHAGEVWGFSFGFSWAQVAGAAAVLVLGKFWQR